MAFGIIPGNERLGTWDLRLRSGEEDPDTELIVRESRDMLTRVNMHPDATVDVLRKSVNHGNKGHWWPAFTDLIGLWSDWIPLNDSPINAVISPMGHRVFTMGEVYEARVVWRWIMMEQERNKSLSTVQSEILNFYLAWEQMHPDWFYRYYWLTPNEPRAVSQRDFFKRMYDYTTRFFLERNKTRPVSRVLYKIHVHRRTLTVSTPFRWTTSLS